MKAFVPARMAYDRWMTPEAGDVERLTVVLGQPLLLPRLSPSRPPPPRRGTDRMAVVHHDLHLAG